MKLIRVATDNGPQQGAVQDGIVYAIDTSAPERLTLGEPIGSLDNFELLVPAEPSKVLCVGRNYADHIAEMGRPMPEWPFFFLKAPNAVVGPDEPIRRPRDIRRFDYEGELAVVIGRVTSRIQADDWRRHALGFTCGNDMTIRDWQEADGQWARAKSADTLCPIGPWIETDVDNPEDLKISTYVNGEVRQESRTSDFVFGIGELLAFISAHLTLVPGDVVLTGTPSGVGNVDVGDVVEVEVEGVGKLRNPVEPR